MRIWLARVAWGAGILLALWVVAWLALPLLIEAQLPPRASEALGRAVTIGEVRVRPWALALEVDDIAVAGSAAGAEPLLKVRRLQANLSVGSFVRGAPVIEALTIDAPRLRVARTADGRYDVDDLIARFATRPGTPPSEPARFAVYNLQVRDAELRFDDRPAGRVHLVDALQLALPFVSNLPAEVDVKVAPRLAFRLNGAPFDSGAQATPFAQSRSGTLTLKWQDLDLVPYLGYLPASVPVRLTRGRVAADLSLRFAMPDKAPPTLALQGVVDASNVALTDAAGRPVADWRQLRLALQDVQPLARRLAFESLRVDGLQLHADRDGAGRLNLGRLAGAPAAVPASAAASTAGARAPLPSAPWAVSLAALDLADARVLWTDAAVAPRVALQLDGLTLNATRIGWPLVRPVAVSLQGSLREPGERLPVLAGLSLKGEVGDHAATLDLGVEQLSIGALSPYLAGLVRPAVSGRLSAQARLDWTDDAAAPRLRVDVAKLAIDALALREPGGRTAAGALTLQRLAVSDAALDLLARRAVLGAVRLEQPAVAIARDADGVTNVERWRVAAAAPASTGEPAAPTTPMPPWELQLKDFVLDGGQVRFVDASATRGGASAQSVRLTLSAVRVALQDAAWHGDGRVLPPAQLQLSARFGGGRDKSARAGSIDYRGRVGLQPLLADGRLQLERLPLHWFAPYAADQVRLSLLHGEGGYRGSVALRQGPGGLAANAAGDALLGDVRIATLPEPGATASAANTDELLSWQALVLKGLRVAVQPGARPKVAVGDIVLSDLYARLVVTEAGRLNLQDMTGAPAGRAPPALADAAASAASAAPVVAAASASAPAAGSPVDLKLGGIRLVNGRVDFSDRFVRPNYSAAMTELNGTLGGFASDSREMATLSLRGRAAGTALLDIGGQVNPTVTPLALDLRAKATDLELAPLSPYAGKYAGYAIERGKLSMEVAYKIDADGRLEAKNRVVLNQLTFGDRIESKDATSLPVRLAVALLKDRDGVIDIDLPVSGSVNDPQFSVGGIVWKLILNLLAKAITSPFSLLAGGGGGPDLSVVGFEPGTATIAPASGAAIDRVANALTERPALKMTVTGAADPASERDALARAVLEARLVAERRREALRAGVGSATAAAAASAPAVLGAADRARLLKQFYKEADIPNKPRNLIGFSKDLPPAEMEALLLTRMPIGDDAMRELALQRGIAVRDALIARGLPGERLFLAAPKLGREADSDGKGEGAWTPQVKLSLTTN